MNILYRYRFHCGKWLSLTKGDGGTCHQKIPVLEDDELKSFKRMIKNHLRLNFFDNHTWVSVFNRPNISRFSRVQRLSTCISVLFLAIVTSAMWFGTITDQNKDSGIKIGPIRLTYQQFFVGLMCSLIIVIPNMAITTIFKKSKPRSSGLQIQDILKKMRRKGHEETKSKKCSKFQLPWWFLFFGYFLVFACVFVSGFFTVFYSLEWGKDKSLDWLLALLFSFTQSEIVVQPILVRCQPCSDNIKSLLQ